MNTLQNKIRVKTNRTSFLHGNRSGHHNVNVGYRTKLTTQTLLKHSTRVHPHFEVGFVLLKP
jgi:hypothetical protein